MFYAVLKVVGVSILVSVFVAWIKLVPRYPKWKYAFLQQLTNTALQTIVFTILFSFAIYPSWLVLALIILFIIWMSVLVANAAVRKAGESMAETAAADPDETQTPSP